MQEKGFHSALFEDKDRERWHFRLFSSPHSHGCCWYQVSPK